MLEEFLASAYKAQTRKTAEYQLMDIMKELPEAELRKLASGTPVAELYSSAEKTADAPDACGPGGDRSFLDRFMGTPLFDQALALEEESIQAEMASQAKQQEMRRTPDTWVVQDGIRLKKRLLELQLAKYEAGETASPDTPAQGSGSMGDVPAEGAGEGGIMGGAPKTAATLGQAKGVFSDLVQSTKALPRSVGQFGDHIEARIGMERALRKLKGVPGVSFMGDIGRKMSNGGLKDSGKQIGKGLILPAAGAAALGGGALALRGKKQEEVPNNEMKTATALLEESPWVKFAAFTGAVLAKDLMQKQALTLGEVKGVLGGLGRTGLNYAKKNPGRVVGATLGAGLGAANSQPGAGHRLLGAATGGIAGGVIGPMAAA